MKAIKTAFENRKGLSFEASQLLYGVSILLTFLAVGRFGLVA